MNAEQAVYAMTISKCSKADMVDALRKNEVSEATIQAALAKNTNTVATTANTAATEAQTRSEEDELLERWLLIAGEEADTVATNALAMAGNMLASWAISKKTLEEHLHIEKEQPIAII